MIVCHQNRQELFLGDYDLFLEKDGWHDGDSGATKKGKQKGNRRERAERVQERSKRLKPIKKRVQQLEWTIEKKELNKATLEEEMLEAGQSGSPDMGELTRKHGVLLKDLEKAYEEIQELFNEEEKIKAELGEE
jgi:ATP-binding cassette subfamily F protein 3